MKLIKFYTKTCPPCKGLKPILDSFIKDHPELEYEEIDCGESIPDEYAMLVRSVPTILIIKPDQPNRKMTGMVTREQLEKEVYG